MLSGVIFVVVRESIALFSSRPGVSMVTAQEPNNTKIIANTRVEFVYFLDGSRKFFVWGFYLLCIMPSMLQIFNAKLEFSVQSNV